MSISGIESILGTSASGIGNAPPAQMSVQELSGAFDELFLRMLWDSIEAGKSEQEMSFTSLGPWRDLFIQQLAHQLSDSGKTGFGQQLIDAHNNSNVEVEND